jgi:hypothetical protein
MRRDEIPTLGLEASSTSDAEGYRIYTPRSVGPTFCSLQLSGAVSEICQSGAAPVSDGIALGHLRFRSRMHGGIMKPQTGIPTGGARGAGPAREIEHPSTIVVTFARFDISIVSRGRKVNVDG